MENIKQLDPLYALYYDYGVPKEGERITRLSFSGVDNITRSIYGVRTSPANGTTVIMVCLCAFCVVFYIIIFTAAFVR